MDFWLEWDWARAAERFRRAIQLNPNNASAHRYYAHLLSNSGRHAEADGVARADGDDMARTPTVGAEGPTAGDDRREPLRRQLTELDEAPELAAAHARFYALGQPEAPRVTRPSSAANWWGRQR